MSSVVTTAEFAEKTQTREPTISQTFARFASCFDLDQVPEAVIERAKLSILDAIGIGLASTTYDFAQRAANAAAALGGSGKSPVIGMDLRLPTRDAVMLNGTLIHGLDYDDTHPGSVIHATTSAVPVMLGLGLERGVDGRTALAAYLLAIELDARIGQAAGGLFQKAGFHPTGIVGAFGCSLAAGYLYGLSEHQLTLAQGIVLSMAGGSLEFLDEGAWTKRMHPGWAGVCGITAAAWAAQGFVGPTRAYEGRFGLYRSHLGDDAPADLSPCTAELGDTWEMQRVAFKPYPACHFNHAFADAALALRQAHGLEPADIESISAGIHENQVQVVCEPQARKRHPQSAYEAQFSVHYVIAAALCRGRFTLDELDDAALRDPEILELCNKISYAIDPESAFPRYYSGVIRIKTRNGREFEHREAVNRGADANPLSVDDVKEKFRSNAQRAVSTRQAARIEEAIAELDRAADLDALAGALSA